MNKLFMSCILIGLLAFLFKWGYSLPIRCTIGKMADNGVANMIEKELIEREKVVSL